MTEPGPADEGFGERPAPVVSTTVAVVAGVGAGVLAVPALDSRSGGGDGFGDLLPLLLMLATVPLMLIGVLLIAVAAAGRLRWAAVTATTVFALGALMTGPVLMFGKPLTATVSACEVVAALAALTAVGVLGTARPAPRDPSPGP